MVSIDLIILSYAQTDELRQVTINSIESLMASEDPSKIKFNIIVMESEKSLNPYQYDYATTIYPDEDFNFHRYFNIGIKRTTSPFICLCNNDLIFYKGWATEILGAFAHFKDVYSASPVCNIRLEGEVIFDREVQFGYGCGTEVQGSCIFIKRELLNIIGQLDPNFRFYYADNDYCNTLEVLNLKHFLVKSSIVYHLGSKTLRKQDSELRLDLTDRQFSYYKKKWFCRLGKEWKLINQ